MPGQVPDQGQERGLTAAAACSCTLCSCPTAAACSWGGGLVDAGTAATPSAAAASALGGSPEGLGPGGLAAAAQGLDAKQRGFSGVQRFWCMITSHTID